MTSAIFIGGHSLGAAEASLYAWSRIKRGLPVDGVYTCGCPRPGNGALGVALSYVPVWRAIKNADDNGYDRVTSVPFDIPIINEIYLDMAPFETCRASPLPNDPWGFFRYHHIELYQKGSRQLAPTGSGVALELVDAVDAIADLYTQSGKWDWQHFVDGQFWGMRIMSSGAKFLVARGSKTVLDWVHDFEAYQIDVMDARVERGFWSGVEPVIDELDKILA